MDLSISTDDRGTLSVVQVEGEIDVYTAPSLRERLDALVRAGRVHLILDLADVDFLDSTGLGVLVGRLKLVRLHGGSLQLVCVDERILRVFSITGLEKVFSIYGSVEEAVARGASREGSREGGLEASREGSREGSRHDSLDASTPGSGSPATPAPT